MTGRLSRPGAAVALVAAITAGGARGQDADLARTLTFPFESGLVAAERAPALAWVRTLGGARSVWIARGPDFKPRAATPWTADDGQELTNLAFSPDGRRLVFVRGGDHDANWPAAGDLAPDPGSSTQAPEVAVWSAEPGRAPVKVAAGDTPAISAKGQLVLLRNQQVWTAPLNDKDGGGKGKAERLFFDRGQDGELAFSPDGSALAFVSDRGDHAFVGVWRGKDAPIAWLAPSTGQDSSPRWSPDGARIAFVRNQGDGGPPDPWLNDIPHPFEIWTADARTGAGSRVWKSPNTPEGSFPEVAGGANLLWATGGYLVFLAELDGWEHLYAVPAAGGAAARLTPGAFMVEDVSLSADKTRVVFSANTGGAAGDGKARPGVIFVHGGPPRQMMLGWHYMDYYSNAYAMNQYLATHGFTVLAVNYRLGIGYGRAYQHPAKWGPQGASEYQDVLGGARFLQRTAGVAPARIGIWGGSYGGYLTALALARDSAIFKAGVDLHGVHDWSRALARDAPAPFKRYEQGDRAMAMATAFAASPDADIARWRSPVLLIQGDDDRNVDFHETVDLARRLETAGVRFEELVLPDEIHGFLRHDSWLKADQATLAFLKRELGVP